MRFALVFVAMCTTAHPAIAFSQEAPPARSTPDFLDRSRNSLPERLDLDRILDEPGTPWSIARVAKRAVETVHLVEAADARVAQAAATTQEVRASAIPRVELLGRYTRLSQINNAPLAPIGVDFESARSVLAEVQDPAAQQLLGGQLDVLQSISEDSIQIPRNQYNFRAVAQYPLLQLFLQILPGIRSAQNGELARRYESNVTRNEVALEIIEIYMTHARARGALAVAELAERQAESNRNQAEALLRRGIGNRPDVLRFEARVAAAQRGRAESQADVESTASALRTLLDLQGDGPLAFEERLTEVPEPPFVDETQDLIDVAWKQRDEMHAATALVRSRGYGTRVARGSMAPGVNVEAGADYGQPNPLYIPPNEQEFRASWNVSAIVSWSPDRTWAASRAKERAVGAEAEAVAQLEQLRDLIRIEVVRAHTAYRASFESIQAAMRQVDAAEEAYSAKTRGFEVGVFSASEVIDAEVDVNRARLALIDAAARLRVRESELRTAIGEHLWE